MGRRPGHCLWFGWFHLTNLLVGEPVTAVIQQCVIASMAGIALYLWRRGAGVLVAGMVIHGLWDLSSFVLGAHMIDGSLLPQLGSAGPTLPTSVRSSRSSSSGGATT